MKETTIMRKIRLKNSNGDCRLFRNNVGMGLTLNGMPLRYGLCIGSSDLIGWKTITIDQSMIGKKMAVFTAVEVKKDTPLSEQQVKFLDVVSNAGGIAKVFYTDEDLL